MSLNQFSYWGFLCNSYFVSLFFLIFLLSWPMCYCIFYVTLSDPLYVYRSFLSYPSSLQTSVIPTLKRVCLPSVVRCLSSSGLLGFVWNFLFLSNFSFSFILGKICLFNKLLKLEVVLLESLFSLREYYYYP